MLLKPYEVIPDIKIINYFSIQGNNNSWGPRRMSDFELILIVSGFFSYTANETTHTLEPGDVLCITPEQLHCLTYNKDSARNPVISSIHLELYPGLSYSANDYELAVKPEMIAKTASNPEIHALFQRSSKLFNQRHSKYSDELLKTMLRELWIRLSEFWENGGLLHQTLRMKNMLKFIDQNLTGKISRTEIAREFELTPEHVNAIFKKELNTTPVKYIKRQRVQQACYYLIEEGRSVKETAMLVGYEDEFYFSKVFKQITGRSPSEASNKKRTVTLS